MLKGSKSPDWVRQKISAGLIGNQYRKGKRHSEQDRRAISAGVKLAYAEGRKVPVPCPENLAAYNLAVQTGQIEHHAAKTERNIRVLADYRRTRSMAETGRNFGITISAVSYIIRKMMKTPKGRRSRP